MQKGAFLTEEVHRDHPSNNKWHTDVSIQKQSKELTSVHFLNCRPSRYGNSVPAALVGACVPFLYQTILDRHAGELLKPEQAVAAQDVEQRTRSQLEVGADPSVNEDSNSTQDERGKPRKLLFALFSLPMLSKDPAELRFERFGKNELLLGVETTKRFAEATVCVVGCGGVVSSPSCLIA